MSVRRTYVVEAGSIVPADPAARKRWLLATFAFLFLVAIFSWLSQSRPHVPETATAQELAVAYGPSMVFFGVAALTIAGAFLAVAYYGIQLANKVVAANLFPPPGKALPFQARVREGNEARRLARRVKFGAIGYGALSLLWLWSAYHSWF